MKKGKPARKKVETVNQRGKMVESTAPRGYSKGWQKSPRSALPTKGEDVGPETGSRAAGISQLDLPPLRAGGQTLQDRRKSRRLARSWMGTNQKAK